ncbi:hypothetical protein R1flu_026823 [Riccia fluitans]|uniref:Uncharacterized protein n=1 Tax=Riccia fluitans TaxID=41844 RepID=A0ABD1XH38_9MARC
MEAEFDTHDTKVDGDTAPDGAAIAEASPVWQAAVRIFTDVPTDDLWMVAKDYCNLDWLSMVTGCVLLEGEGNTVGTVRRCTNDGPDAWFSDEKLVEIHHETRSLTYQMVDSSFGWIEYRATLSVRTDYDGRNFLQLKGQQLPRGGSTEEVNVNFMRSAFGVFLTDLESKARTLQLSRSVAS